MGLKMRSIPQYKPESPYYKTPIINNQLSYLNYRNIPKDSTDPLYVIPLKYHMKPGRLAYDLYGSSRYWWVFMIRNPDIIKDPIYDMVTGTTIYLPQKKNLNNI